MRSWGGRTTVTALGCEMWNTGWPLCSRFVYGHWRARAGGRCCTASQPTPLTHAHYVWMHVSTYGQNHYLKWRARRGLPFIPLTSAESRRRRVPILYVGRASLGSPGALTRPVSTTHARSQPAARYGFDAELLPRPGYWPDSAVVCGESLDTSCEAETCTRVLTLPLLRPYAPPHGLQAPGAYPQQVAHHQRRLFGG